MKNAIKYEWIRLTTIRSTWVCLGLALLTTIAGSIISAVALLNAQKGSTLDLPGAVLGSVSPVVFLLTLIAIYSFGNEFTHGTIKLTLIAFSKRWQILFSKVVVTALLSFIVSAFLFSLVVGVTLATEQITHNSLSTPDMNLVGVIARTAVYSSLLSVLGLALAGILRSITVPIIIILTGPVAEILIGALLSVIHWQKVAEFLPFTLGDRFYQKGDWLSGLTFLLYILIVLMICKFFLEKRDVGS